MKKILFSLVISLFLFQNNYASVLELNSTNDTLDNYECLFKGNIKHGWYVSFGNYYQQINKKDASSFHFTGAWVIDKKVAIGLTGYGFSGNNGRLTFKDSTEKDIYLDGGCGGITIEPIIMANRRIHITFPVFVGAGGFVLNSKDDLNYSTSSNYSKNTKTKKIDAKSAFVLEPGVDIEINVFKFMKLGIGAKYRHTSDVKLNGFSKDILKGFSFGWNLKFGKY